jgi:glutamine amidotransferase
MTGTISVIDYGAGNIGSIVNMIRKLGGDAALVSTPERILSAEKLILPGVGHFDFGMRTLNESGMVGAMHEAVEQKGTPILGICLGAQLMTRSSQEGSLPGLGWFDANVLSFRNEWHRLGLEGRSTTGTRLRTPHMGWNYVQVVKNGVLTNELPADPRFYFVHSYYIHSNLREDVMLETTYGVPFVAALQHQNKYAVQFHPEKSHKFGLKLFDNFLKL